MTNDYWTDLPEVGGAWEGEIWGQGSAEAVDSETDHVSYMLYSNALLDSMD